MQSTLAFTNESFADENSAGSRLRRAREELRLSLRDVATSLHLLVSHVRAIETDRCEHLAGDDEFLAYMHNYARLVGLDADELIDSYHKQLVTPEEPIQPLPDGQKAAKRRKVVVLIVCTVLSVCLGIWLLKSDPSAPTESGAENTANGISDIAGSAASSSAATPLHVPKPLGVVHDDKPARSHTAASPINSDPQARLRSSEWFAGLASDRYTLQLVSLTEKTSSEDFIRSRSLEDQAAYIPIRNNDSRIWYAVTYGLYDSFSAAEQAIQSLPASISTLQPRIRNTGRLQRLMLR